MSISRENYEPSVITNSGTFDDGKELVQLFPIPVDSLKGSVSFAKNFTLLALSVISYSRGMFPAYAYTEKNYKGHSIKILNGRGACEEAHLVLKWMRSAFKALEKGYMRELIFEVVSVEETVVEHYVVEYGYDENNISCSINASDKTIAQFDHASFQETFINVVAAITSFVKELKPLPAVFKLQLRINYYDAKTPETYIPDYFRDECFDPSISKTLSISLMGSINTPFHNLTVRMASHLKRSAEGEYISDQSQKRMKGVTKGQPTQKISTLELEQALMSQQEDKENITLHSNEPEKTSNAHKTFEALEHRRHYKPHVPSPQLQYLKGQDDQRNIQRTIEGTSGTISGPSSTTPTSKKANSQESKFTRTVQMNCICNLNDNSRSVFECFHCQKWHHLVCYKRKPTSTINPTSKYTCAKCAIEDGSSECLDPIMAVKNVPIKSIEGLAVYRQVIFQLRWFTLINMKILTGDFRITEEKARSIISKLLKKNILRPCTRSEDYTLNHQQLMAFVNSYFK